MAAVKEKFPSRGDTITLQAMEKRPHPKGENHLIYKVDVLVTSVHPEESLLMGVELKRICYFEGEEENRRKLPPENPYGTPRTNGYMLTEHNWSVIND